MLEVDPALAHTKPVIVVFRFGIGNRKIQLALCLMEKLEGVVVSIADFGTISNGSYKKSKPLSRRKQSTIYRLHVCSGKSSRIFRTASKHEIKQGGGHHTVVSLNLTVDQMVHFAKLVNAEYVVL
ncbi:hypothetical protein ACEQPO_19850 [Bacillus sp. SL00103]